MNSSENSCSQYNNDHSDTLTCTSDKYLSKSSEQCSGSNSYNFTTNDCGSSDSCDPSSFSSSSSSSSSSSYSLEINSSCTSSKSDKTSSCDKSCSSFEDSDICVPCVDATPSNVNDSCYEPNKRVCCPEDCPPVKCKEFNIYWFGSYFSDSGNGRLNLGLKPFLSLIHI